MAPCLLLVHTASDDREMYAEYLTGEGFRVIEAATTDAAIPRIPEADVVVTGLLVPGSIEPVELIARIRQNPPTEDKPVIVVTACALSPMLDRARRAGADEVLLKPCLPDALVAEIRRVLKQRASATGETPMPHEDRRNIRERRGQWRGGRRDSDWQGRRRTLTPARTGGGDLLWFAPGRRKHRA